MTALTMSDFAEMFGTSVDLLSDECKQRIEKGNWHYEVLTVERRDKAIVEILDRIDTRELSIAENEDKSRWERGWSENLKEFKKSKGNLEALVPKYIRRGLPLRLKGELIQVDDPDFELNWYKIFRLWFFQNYLSGFSNIFEFGSGSGHNVASLSKMYPNSVITGVDWAEASVEIIERLQEDSGLNVRGKRFDFFHPDNSLDIPSGSALFTIGALEQTGKKWENLLDYILEKKPDICLHIEPILEWYDARNNLVDYSAYKAHLVRNFLNGFVKKIEELEKQGKALIVKSQRTGVGSFLMEGYSQFFWKPIS